ncbi:MAG: isoprenylcysteine carboxylmethyltransferase family protein [Gemmatimonadota bacterium]|nr:isoprenylcysteine carboxylmethyltransferase family protein [Gemmatimonadota bacterium]
MLIERYIRRLLNLADKERSPAFKALALAEGTIGFMVLIPWFLILLGGLVSERIPFAWPGWVDTGVGLVAGVSGLSLLAWSVWAQWTIGKGTPNLVSPTSRLVIKGPYRLCRNPIQLGAMLYYLGAGAYFLDTTAGLFAFAVAFVLGFLYNRCIEEKELRARFGGDYEEYRKTTSFLFPRIW